MRVGPHLLYIVVKSVLYISVDGAYWAAVALNEDIVGSIPQCACKLVAFESANGVLVEGDVAVEVPFPVFAVNGCCSEGYLKTFVGDIARVGEHV